METLGSTTVIGSDKTGTLTKNEMTVKGVYAGDQVYEVTGEGYEPKGEILSEWLAVDSGLAPELEMVFRIGLLCNESDLYEEDGVYRVDGDPTEAALIVSAMKAGLNAEVERTTIPKSTSFLSSRIGVIWPPCTGTEGENGFSSKGPRRNFLTSAPLVPEDPGRK